MKKMRPVLFSSAAIFMITTNSLLAQVAINTTNSDPDPSALLDVNSTSKGILLPRMTKANRDLISSPAIGLMIYQTDETPGFYCYNGSTWSAVSGGGGDSGWGLTGNANTDSLVSFLGTTDNKPLSFRHNNHWAGFLSSNLVALGDSAGINTLMQNGFPQVWDWNGMNCTYLGNAAGKNNTYGSENVAVGYRSLYHDEENSYNTAIGAYSLFTNGIGGWSADYNTAVGYSSLYNNIHGQYNVAIGYNAMYSNTESDYNTAIGHEALYSNTLYGPNTAIGYMTLWHNVGDQWGGGQCNVAIGDAALYENIDGGYNTACGSGTLHFNQSGYYNTANGSGALNNNTFGYSNTGLGNGALFRNETGNNNTAVGDAALNRVRADNNTAIGAQALRGGTSGYITGWGNTAGGYYSMRNTTGTGHGNTSFGDSALYTNTIGNYNTAIGYQANVSSNNLNNATAVGYGTTVTASNNMIFGNSSVVGWGFGVAPGAAAFRVGTDGTNGNGATLTLAGVWTDASDSTKKYDIKNIPYGMKEVLKLRPVTYKIKGQNNQDIGFLAQEVKKIIPEVVYGKEGEMTLSYGQLTAVLVKALQDQQNTINDLKKRIEQLEKK